MSVDLMTDIPEELKYVSKPCLRPVGSPVGSMAHAVFGFIRLCKRGVRVRKKENRTMHHHSWGKPAHTARSRTVLLVDSLRMFRG